MFDCSINGKLASCNICELKFEQFNELETHIENEHKEEEKFKCGKCNKTFYLQWRLNKHEQWHTQRSSKPCKYFTSKRECPFEKLGCKFVHQEISATDAGPKSQSDNIADDDETPVIAKQIETLEDDLRKSKEQNEEYSDLIAKADRRALVIESQNKKLKDKLIEYRSALKKLTDAYELK